MSRQFGDILSDFEEEMRTGMVRVALTHGEFSVGSPFAKELLKSLEGDEKIGAQAIEHNGGDVIVHVNLWEINTRPPRKRPMSRSRIIRWLVKRGDGPYPWSYQARFAAASCGSSESTRAKALEAAKRWIDEQHRKRINGRVS